MKVAVIGRGNVGGGLADRWERAGHEVTRIGRDGGDVSNADAVSRVTSGSTKPNRPLSQAPSHNRAAGLRRMAFPAKRRSGVVGTPVSFPTSHE